MITQSCVEEGRSGIRHPQGLLMICATQSARLALSLPGLSSAHPPIPQMAREAKPVAQILTAGLWQERWLVQGEGWAGCPTFLAIVASSAVIDPLPVLCSLHVYPCSGNYCGSSPSQHSAYSTNHLPQDHGGDPEPPGSGISPSPAFLSEAHPPQLPAAAPIGFVFSLPSGISATEPHELLISSAGTTCPKASSVGEGTQQRG